MGWWSVDDDRWVNSNMIGGSVVKGRWKTCRWVGGRLSVVGGFVIRPIYKSASNSFFLFSDIKNVKQNLIKFCLSNENEYR